MITMNSAECPMMIGGSQSAAHPLYGSADLAGRVITAFDPDGYVLVDGLLVRALMSAGRASPGEIVALEFDPFGTLLAHAAGSGRV
jgi:hypothetical protein